ncbi:MAG: CoA transferase [Chloroflexota bacterium]|nr:CoA transferase [Chloroflexota bacterium]
MLLPDNRVWVRQLLASAFAGRTRDEWLRLLEEGDCPAGPLCGRDEWLDHPQVGANGLRMTLHDPERGAVVMPSLPLALSKTPGRVAGPAPRLGQDDGVPEKWRSESRVPGPESRVQGRVRPLRPSEAASHQTGDSGPGTRDPGPLAGYRVLDLGTIVAGPYAGVLLAELGADVIKVESPAGDAFRETGFVYNRGMRGLAMDLSSPEGRSAFHKLASSADTVVDNSRQGVAERLGADYASLSRHKPDIVSLGIAGFGELGPLAHKPAFDPVLQAMSGMMGAQGGDSDPVLYTVPINDVGAAATAALGVCLGLFHRARTGDGQRVSTSLVAMSLLMQSGELVRFAGRPPAQRGGRDFAGPSAAARFYATSDGWLLVRAPSDAALRDALGLAGSCSDLAEAVGQKLASIPAEQALQLLTEAGVSAVPARQPAEVAGDPHVRGAKALCRLQFADGRPYLAPLRYARFSRTEVDVAFQPPGLGEHSRQVLAEAGIEPAHIEALIEQRVVFQGAPVHLQGLVSYR